MIHFTRPIPRPFPTVGSGRWTELANVLSQAVMPTSVTIASLFLLLTTSCSILESGPPIGSPMPEILAKNLNGRPQLISPKFAPCIFFFYNSSCHHCKRLLDSILPYYRRKGSLEPKIFLLIQQGWRTSSPPGLFPGFPVLKISSDNWHSAFQVKRTPTLLFYDTRGRLLSKQLGWRSEADQEKILNSFLQEIQSRLSALPFCQPRPDMLTPNPVVWLIQTKRRFET